MTDSKPSKTERKRLQHDLQQLGESLIALDAVALDAMPLNEKLRQAIADAARIRSRGALRRQKQLIGKLMRDVDPEPIRAAIARLTADDILAKQVFALAERWRDRIVTEGLPALEQFNEETGTADAGLRRSIGDLEFCISDRAEKTLRREIFRRVHEILGKLPP